MQESGGAASTEARYCGQGDFEMNAHPSLKPTAILERDITPVTLPETGSSNSSVALGGLLLLAVGLGAVLIGAFARRPGDQPTL